MSKRLTAEQVARRLGVNVKRVYEAIRANKLQAQNVSIGSLRPRWRVREEDADLWGVRAK